MVEAYKKIALQRTAGPFWSQENERNLKDLNKKVLKMTKKHLRDFRIISEEIG
jgi:hypothetical protein